MERIKQRRAALLFAVSSLFVTTVTILAGLRPSPVVVGFTLGVLTCYIAFIIAFGIWAAREAMSQRAGLRTFSSFQSG